MRLLVTCLISFRIPYISSESRTNFYSNNRMRKDGELRGLVVNGLDFNEKLSFVCCSFLIFNGSEDDSLPVQTSLLLPMTEDIVGDFSSRSSSRTRIRFSQPPPQIFSPLLVFQIGAHVFLFSHFWFSRTDLSSADFVILLTGPSPLIRFIAEILPPES